MVRFLDYLRGVEILRKDSQSSISEKLFTLNRKFFSYFFRILSIIFPKFLCASTALFAFLLIAVVSLEVIIFNVGLLPGQYYKVLNNKDLNTFRGLVIKSFAFIIINALLKSLSDYIANLLRIVWRQLLTLRLHSDYFHNKNFYYLQCASKKLNPNSHVNQKMNTVRATGEMVGSCASTSILIENPLNITNVLNGSNFINLDNPDQRITQDVDNMLASMAKITPIILTSPFIIGYYIYQGFVKVGYSGPLAVFIYFLIGSILNGPLMSPIAAVVYMQDKLEGNFRYKHMSIRTHAESVAFFDSEKRELSLTNSIFQDLLTISYRRNWKEFLLKVCINMLQYLGSILSYLILAIPIFTNIYSNLKPEELGELISNYAFICNYLVFLFTRLYDLSNEISIIGGNSHRIGQLLEETEQKKDEITENQNEQQAPKEANINDSVCLVIKNLTVMTPDKQKTLIKNLNFTLEKNHKILITGKSGCGKTSLLRCISGLWKSYNGHIILNFDSMRPTNIFFLPQTPYFTNGSLLEQIIYPSSELETKYTSDEINTFISTWLKKFDMTHVLEKVNWSAHKKPNFHWPSILSLGEQQRLSFLRIIYHKPKFALLDEFTSSVDQEVEAMMYEELGKLNITFLSIAHRDTVKKFHDIELRIENDGNYQIFNINN